MLHTKSTLSLSTWSFFLITLILAPACSAMGPVFSGRGIPAVIAFIFIVTFIALIIAAFKVTVKIGGAIIGIIIVAFGILFIPRALFMVGHGVPMGDGILSLGAPLLGLLWIFVLIWIYRDAEDRGMNGALWTLLVLVGSVVALIVYLLVRNEAITSGVTTPANINCPNCRKSIRADFTYCPHCSAKVNAVCASCNKPVETGWKTCPHCGKKLSET
jgi:hypothetical protein